MSEALKPCPFCGSKATIIDSHDEVYMDGPLPYGVECDGCGVDIGGWHSPEDAAYEWNTRAALEQPSTAEPVAWCWEHLGMHVTTDRERARQMIADGVDLQPLYTAPPSTAEVRARELEGAAKAMQVMCDGDTSEAQSYLEYRAKRIREEAK